MTAPTSITTQAFLEHVHRHLTPVMEARGYVFCGGGAGRATFGPEVLTRVPRWASALRLRRWPPRLRQLEPVLSAGFEGGEDDERWVFYYPARQHLDLTQFDGVVRVNGPETVAEDQIDTRLQSAAAHIEELGLDH